MRYIIDLVDDIREEIGHERGYSLSAMLLRDDPDKSQQLISDGEVSLGRFEINSDEKKITFTVDKEKVLYLEDIVKHLLLLPVGDMMFEIEVAVNREHPSVEVIGFGKNTTEKKYFLFIKI